MSILSSELTNLLPRSSVRGLRREYFVRLFTVGLLLATVVVVIHGVLLIPAYLYAHSEVVREQGELAEVAASSTSAEERQINQKVATVKNDIAYLGRLSTQPAASAAVRALLGVAHPGIKLTGFSFTAPATAGGSAKMDVTGTAATRDSLRTYVEALDQLPYVSKADLPISAYAKESDIPFTVTLSGTLRP
jgi:hypothetical protein